ncbi:MAG: hypothetical protein H6767_02870 [Candidatus Peribacteria bacterium]|nr:MAG: hypothetical protein H6767_02870 [Candidatus Peribacteria bacterium]
MSGSEDTSSSGSTESILPEVEGSGAIIIEPKESEADIKIEESKKMLTFSESSECESLQYLVQECKDSFVLKLAEKTGQIKFCSKIQDSLQKQICENNISFMKQDCYSIIGDSELKTSCLDKQKEEKEKQVAEQTEEKIMMTAKNSNNYDGCSTLESFTKITQCIEPIAIEEQNIFICNEVFTDNNEKLDCIESIAYTYDRAIIRKAFSNKDLSICENIYNYEAKEQCKQMQLN